MLDKFVVLLLTLKAKLTGDLAQDILEYGLIGGGVALALVVALVLFTDDIGSAFDFLGSCIDFSNGFPTCGGP